MRGYDAMPSTALSSIPNRSARSRASLRNTTRFSALWVSAAEIDWTGLPDPQLSAAAESAQSEEADQLKTLVWGAVEELSPPQRAAMLLFYQHSLGCTEISQVLQVPVATVKSHLHRGRMKLKELLEPAFGEESARMRLLGELAG